MNDQQAQELTPEQTARQAWTRTAAGQKGMRMSMDFLKGFLAARPVPVERPDEGTGELERLIEEQRILRAALRPFADAARSLKGLPAKISESEQTAIPSRFFLAALDALEAEAAASQVERPDEGRARITLRAGYDADLGRSWRLVEAPRPTGDQAAAMTELSFPVPVLAAARLPERPAEGLLKTIATAIERAQAPDEEPDAEVMARAVLDALAARPVSSEEGL